MAVERSWAETFGEPLPKDLGRLAPEELNANARYVIAFREDSGGEPSVYVTVVFRDDAAPKLWPQRAALASGIREIAQRAAPDVWPYIEFSAEDECLNPENPPA